MMTTLLGISGSLRKQSTNRKLLGHASAVFDAAEYVEGNIRFPLYDGDLEAEQGIPTVVQTLADQIKEADAVIIATPEYNKSISGVLKNALDWISRADGSVWHDKPVAIMSATAGRAGGERAQFALRLCMMPFRADLLQGPEVLIANSGNAFGENDRLTDERSLEMLHDLMGGLKARI